MLEEFQGDLGDPADVAQTEKWPAELYVWNDPTPGELAAGTGAAARISASANTRLAIVASSPDDLRAKCAKAKTALGFRLPTKMLEDAVAAGGSGTRLLALQDVAPFEGGFPIIVDGKIVVRHGRSTLVDEELILAEAQASVKRRMARLGLEPTRYWEAHSG